MSHPVIEIGKAHLNALNVALYLASERNEMGTLSHIKFEAAGANGRGRMIATDGFAMVISEDAHTSPETLYVRTPTPKRIRLAPTTHAVTIVDGVLVETRAKSKGEHSVEVRREEHGYIAFEPGDKIGSRRQYPDVDRVLPNEKADPQPLVAPVDAVRGGEIAKAYDAPYDLACWARTSNKRLAYLQGARAHDLVILNTLREPAYDRYNGSREARGIAV